MFKRSLFALLLVGCGTDGGETTTTPLVSADTVALHFTQHASDASLDYQFEVATNQLSGYRIETLADQRLCRHRVATATAIASPAAFVAALAGSDLVTLTGEKCAAALRNCGGPDEFLNVSVDGGQTFTMQPSMCQELVADPSLETSLRAAFDSLGTVDEIVQWTGTDYVASGPCFPPG
jgi:hypothetical protein